MGPFSFHLSRLSSFSAPFLIRLRKTVRCLKTTRETEFWRPWFLNNSQTCWDMLASACCMPSRSGVFRFHSTDVISMVLHSLPGLFCHIIRTNQEVAWRKTIWSLWLTLRWKRRRERNSHINREMSYIVVFTTYIITGTAPIGSPLSRAPRMGRRHQLDSLRGLQLTLYDDTTSPSLSHLWSPTLCHLHTPSSSPSSFLLTLLRLLLPRRQPSSTSVRLECRQCR